MAVSQFVSTVCLGGAYIVIRPYSCGSWDSCFVSCCYEVIKPRFRQSSTQTHRPQSVVLFFVIWSTTCSEFYYRTSVTWFVNRATCSTGRRSVSGDIYRRLSASAYFRVDYCGDASFTPLAFSDINFLSLCLSCLPTQYSFSQDGVFFTVFHKAGNFCESWHVRPRISPPLRLCIQEHDAQKMTWCV